MNSVLWTPHSSSESLLLSSVISITFSSGQSALQFLPHLYSQHNERQLKSSPWCTIWLKWQHAFLSLIGDRFWGCKPPLFSALCLPHFSFLLPSPALVKLTNWAKSLALSSASISYPTFSGLPQTWATHIHACLCNGSPAVQAGLVLWLSI